MRKSKNGMVIVIMCEEREVYSVSCIGMLPFIEGSLGDGTSGLVAVSRMIVKSTLRTSLLKGAVASARMAGCPDVAW